MTLAPELPGGIDLVASLSAAGHVALGHSAADFERRLRRSRLAPGTRPLNRMTPIFHRCGPCPGPCYRGKTLRRLICDGFMCIPATCRVASVAKGPPPRVMATTDGTAASGLPVGSFARLEGPAHQARGHAAFLEDGTLAGSHLDHGSGVSAPCNPYVA